MVTMKSVANWSLQDFKDIQTLDDLIWWHNQTIAQHKLLNGVDADK